MSRSEKFRGKSTIVLINDAHTLSQEVIGPEQARELASIFAELSERASSTRCEVPKILVQDDDEHWYLIPEDKLNDWCLLGSLDAADVPDWVKPVDSPRSVKIVAYLPIAPANG